jgi:hypothetical protein
MINKLLQYGADRYAKDSFGHSALLYAARHGYVDCVRSLLWQSAPINDGSLHEAARNLHFQTVEVLLKAGHDANYASDVHGGRTPLAEMCLLADVKNSGQAFDYTFRVLADGGADPLKASGTQPMQPIFLALANNDPKPVIEMLLHVFLPRNVLESPALVVECDHLVYSPTMYLKKVVLPSGSHAARDQRNGSGGAIRMARSMANMNIPYPEDFNLTSNIEMYNPNPLLGPGGTNPAISRAFHIANTNGVYNELLTMLIRTGARDRFYCTSTDTAVQPADMTGAPDEMIYRENVRRGELARLQAASPAHMQHPGPAPPPKLPPRGPGGRPGDELHLWDNRPDPQAQLRARLAEEKRQVEERRALSELVNAHSGAYLGLKREAATARTREGNKWHLDGRVLRTQFEVQMAAEGRGDGRVMTVLEEETTRVVAVAKNERLGQLKLAKEKIFVDEEARQVGRRVSATTIGERNGGSPVSSVKQRQASGASSLGSASGRRLSSLEMQVSELRV